MMHNCKKNNIWRGLKLVKWPWRLLKVIGIACIRWAIYHFLLVVCSWRLRHEAAGVCRSVLNGFGWIREGLYLCIRLHSWLFPRGGATTEWWIWKCSKICRFVKYAGIMASNSEEVSVVVIRRSTMESIACTWRVTKARNKTRTDERRCVHSFHPSLVTLN